MIDIDPAELRIRALSGRGVGEVDVDGFPVVCDAAVDAVDMHGDFRGKLPRQPEVRLLRSRIPEVVGEELDVGRRGRSELQRITPEEGIGIRRVGDPDVVPDHVQLFVLVLQQPDVVVIDAVAAAQDRGSIA